MKKILYLFLFIFCFTSSLLSDDEILVDTPQTVLKRIDGEVCLFQNGVPYPAYEKQKYHLIYDLKGLWKKERVSVDHDLTLLPRQDRFHPNG